MPTSADAWDGCQYHEPESQSGLLLVYRLGDSKQEEMLLTPRAVGTPSSYDWSVVAGDAVVRAVNGGLTLRMAASHAALIHYRLKR